MAKLLCIRVSPRGWNSYSNRAAQAFLDAYRKTHPQDGVDDLDLSTADLPEFSAPQAAAKYAVMAGQTPTDEAGLAWKRVIDVINRFTSADRYVIASPMWNFGIPYRLKQYIDIIVQPGLTIAFSPETGYRGLVTGRTAVLILARGGAYEAGDPVKTFDFQKSYLEMILGFIGLTDIRSILIEPTLGEGPEGAEKALQSAIRQAEALAEKL